MNLRYLHDKRGSDCEHGAHGANIMKLSYRFACLTVYLRLLGESCSFNSLTRGPIDSSISVLRMYRRCAADTFPATSELLIPVVCAVTNAKYNTRFETPSSEPK